MAQEDVHLSDAGLALGLSLGVGTGCAAASEAVAHRSTTGRPRRASPCPLDPSLTLSTPAATATATGTTASGGGARSVSSLSVAAAGVKRERVEEAETERASSAAAALRTGARAAGDNDYDDDDGSTRKKLRLTKEQSALLEDRFKDHSTLNPKQKVALAKQLNLRPRQVEVWFQNRRARTKLKQTEVDCEFLKRCCETLTEENRRLQRELQELRALKFAAAPPHAAGAAAPPPFYVQLPAATLTICPSCDRLLGGPAAAAKADPDKAGTVSRTTAHHFFNPFTHSAAC